MKYFKCLESKLKCECPGCGSFNYYVMSMTRNEPTHDVDGLICWNCKQGFFFDEVNAEMNENDVENGFFENGEKK